VVATLKADLDTWATRPLGELDVVYAYLDAMGLPVRTGGRVVRVPVLAVVGVLADGG
jgi:transposase-like protein